MGITICNLTKKFAEVTALNNINLTINQGMFGLLGPNGAGKTTLMRILTTLLNKTSGTVKVNNIDIENKQQIREIIGYLPQEFSLYPKMTVFEAMDYLSLLAGIKSAKFRKQNIIELLEKVNLLKFKKTKVRALSGGMKRRLGIAQALINNPQLLVVDEPTAGLDPEERIRFRNLLSDFAKDRIVILSTHIAGDIEFTCNDLAILNKGHIVYQGSVTNLLKNAENSVWSVIIDRSKLNELRQKNTIISSVSEGHTARIKLLSKNKPFSHATMVKPTIEDDYMKLMKEVK